MRRDANEDQELHNDEAESRARKRRSAEAPSRSGAEHELLPIKDGFFTEADLPELQKRWPGITLEEAHGIARTGGG